MTEFFDKLRRDRKLDESLALMGTIADPLVASKLKVFLAMHLADVKTDLPVFKRAFSHITGALASS